MLEEKNKPSLANILGGLGGIGMSLLIFLIWHIFAVPGLQERKSYVGQSMAAFIPVGYVFAGAVFLIGFVIIYQELKKGQPLKSANKDLKT